MSKITHIVVRRLDDREAIGIAAIPYGVLVCGAYLGPNPNHRSDVFLTEISEVEYTSYEALGILPVYGWDYRKIEKLFVYLFNKEFFETCPSGTNDMKARVYVRSHKG